MERFTLNGLISDTVREAVNLTNQLNCLLEIGTSIEDGIYVNNHENRELLRQAREALWGVERAVRGCDVVTNAERTGDALKTLVASLLEEMGTPTLRSVAQMVDSTIDNIDFGPYVNSALVGIDWSDYDVVSTYGLEDWMSSYLSGVDWSEYDLVTEDEVDTKIEDFCDEDKVHDIAATMISSLEVVIRRNF